MTGNRSEAQHVDHNTEIGSGGTEGVGAGFTSRFACLGKQQLIPSTMKEMSVYYTGRCTGMIGRQISQIYINFSLAYQEQTLRSDSLSQKRFKMLSRSSTTYPLCTT